MLDNDDAGLNATVKNGDLLTASDAIVKVVRLSGTKDPDEYVRANGVDALKDNIKNALKYIDFKLEYLKNGKNLNNLEDIISYVKEVISSLNSQDDLTKSIIVSKISKDYQIDAELIKKKLLEHKKEEKKINVSEQRKISKYDMAVSLIIYYMMCDSKYITIYQNRLGYFKNKIERVVASEIIYYYNEYGKISIAEFTSYIMHDSESYEFILKVIGQNQTLELNPIEFDACIEVILGILKKDEIAALKTQIKNELDINKKCELLSKMTELKKEV
jgi:DNA primase